MGQVMVPVTAALDCCDGEPSGGPDGCCDEPPDAPDGSCGEPEDCCGELAGRLDGATGGDDEPHAASKIADDAMTNAAR